MTGTARLGLEMIEAGQVDKSTTHNEALAKLDILVGAAVGGVLVNTPPASPAIGDCHIVGAAPTGAWSGHALALAGYTAGGWRFVAATEGLSARIKGSGETVTYAGVAWETGQVRAARVTVGGDQVVGPRLAAIADPAGGTVIDTQARAAIAAILARLRSHGLIAS